MVSCPHCQQPVLEMALKCRHCGGTLDEHTMCLGEEALLAEIQALRQEQTTKASKQKRMLHVGLALMWLGGLVAVGGVLVEALPVRLGTMVGGLLLLGLGFKLRQPKPPAPKA